MMTEEDKNKLKTRVVEIVLYVREREEDKKAYSSSCNEDIKGGKEKIDALADAIKSGDVTCLANAYDEYEIGELLK